MAISKDKDLAMGHCGGGPVHGSGQSLLLPKRHFRSFNPSRTKIDKINLVLREGLIGIRVIRAFNRNEDEKRRFQMPILI